MTRLEFAALEVNDVVYWDEDIKGMGNVERVDTDGGGKQIAVLWPDYEIPVYYTGDDAYRLTGFKP